MNNVLSGKASEIEQQQREAANVLTNKNKISQKVEQKSWNESKIILSPYLEGKFT